MKFTTGLFTTAALLAPSASAMLLNKDFRGHNIAHHGPAGSDADGVEQFWHEQFLNHYELTDETTWKQRAYINDQYYDGSGPVFLYIGGEGPLTSSSLTDRMYMNVLGQEHNALLLGLEHRYYGESYPTEDMSTDNLKKYLSSQQALADLANFQNAMTEKHDLPEGTKWVTFGGSYPGSLSAWAREKYPSSFYGAVASSAPVEALAPFVQYAQVCDSALQYWGGDECVSSITAAVEAVQKLIDANDPSLADLFNPCSPMKTDLDISVFQMTLYGNVQGTVQYNNEISGAMTVKDICDVMAAGSDPLTQFASMTSTALGGECAESNYEEYIGSLKNATFDGESAMRQWTFQSCNEFGFWQEVTSDANSFQAFKQLDLASQQVQCADVFDMQSDPATGFSNMYYGSTHNDGTRIIFPSGSGDPWHALGMTNDTKLANDELYPVELTMTAHCRDMYAPGALAPLEDPATVTWGQGVIADHINEWMSS